MARLSSHKKEAFCLKVIELGNQGDAYRAATGSKGSDKSCREWGSKWAAEPEVAERILELRREIADKVIEKVSVDAAWVLEELKYVYEQVISEKKFSVALKALEILGKHVDVQAFKDNVDHRHFMSPEEARSVLTSLLPRYASRLETLQ